MARLLLSLIRHGDYHQQPGVPSAHQPYALNSNGRQQARAAADELAALIEDNHWTLEPVIDSSQMLRAWQTAGIFADTLQAVADSRPAVACFDALAERGLGCAANLTIDQIEAVLRDDPRYPPPPANWKADSHYCLPLQGAESLMDAGARVAAHLEQAMTGLKCDTGGRLKIIVGHGAAFRHAACRLGLLDFDKVRQYSMYHCRPLLLEYRAAGEWRHIGGAWKPRGKQDEFTD